MDHTKFWKLIDDARMESAGRPERQLDSLWEKLVKLSPDEIVAFNGCFEELHARAYTWDLWAAAYIIGGGCSDDGFVDFRGWLISRGKEAYEAALENPNSLIGIVTNQDDGGQVEGFHYVAIEAWEEKTGKSMEDFPESDFIYPDEPSGEAWSEDDVVARFPELAKAFG